MHILLLIYGLCTRKEASRASHQSRGLCLESPRSNIARPFRISRSAMTHMTHCMPHCMTHCMTHIKWNKLKHMRHAVQKKYSRFRRDLAARQLFWLTLSPLIRSPRRTQTQQHSTAAQQHSMLPSFAPASPLVGSRRLYAQLSMLRRMGVRRYQNFRLLSNPWRYVAIMFEPNMPNPRVNFVLFVLLVYWSEPSPKSQIQLVIWKLLKQNEPWSPWSQGLFKGVAPFE